MSSSLTLSPRPAIIQFFFEHDQVFSIAIDVAAFVLVAIRTLLWVDREEIDCVPCLHFSVVDSLLGIACNRISSTSSYAPLRQNSSFLEFIM